MQRDATFLELKQFFSLKPALCLHLPVGGHQSLQLCTSGAADIRKPPGRCDDVFCLNTKRLQPLGGVNQLSASKWRHCTKCLQLRDDLLSLLCAASQCLDAARLRLKFGSLGKDKLRSLHCAECSQQRAEGFCQSTERRFSRLARIANLLQIADS